MQYLEKLIEKDQFRHITHLNIFFHCAEMIPPQFNSYGILSNLGRAGKMFTSRGYFLPNVYAMYDCWPAAIEVLGRVAPHLKITCYAVSNAMLGYDDMKTAGYLNPVRLVKPKKFHEAHFTNVSYPRHTELPPVFDIQNHWEVLFENKFVPAGSNSIVYAAAYEGKADYITHVMRVLYKIEQQLGRVIDSPKYVMKTFQSVHEFSNAKELIERWLPHYYPKTLNCNDLVEAHLFLLQNRHIVMKPSNGVGGDDVYIYDLRDKSTSEIDQIVNRFKTDFKSLLDKMLSMGINHVILQKFVEGILVDGETRIYIMDGKILPYGMQMYEQDPDKPFKPGKGAQYRPMLLNESYLKVAKDFIDTVHHKFDCFYYGLDVLRDIQEDGTERFYIIEANYGTAGFFPDIADIMKRTMSQVRNHVENLSDIYKPYILIHYMDTLVYKPAYQQLYDKKRHQHITYYDKDLYGPPFNLLLSLFNKCRKEIVVQEEKVAQESKYSINMMEKEHLNIVETQELKNQCELIEKETQQVVKQSFQLVHKGKAMSSKKNVKYFYKKILKNPKKMESNKNKKRK